MQSTFHGPLAYELVYPLPPIFTRMRPPTAAEAEDGLSLRKERSFYRNTYSMVRVRSCHILPIHSSLYSATYTRAERHISALFPSVLGFVVLGQHIVPVIVLLPGHQASYHLPPFVVPSSHCPGITRTCSSCAWDASVGEKTRCVTDCCSRHFTYRLFGWRLTFIDWTGTWQANVAVEGLYMGGG